MKAWADAVLTHMFYVAYEAQGRRLEGTPLLIAATAGNVMGSYAPDGQNLLPLADLLAPWRATAHRCGLPWMQPFFVYEADRLGPEALGLAGQRYARRLRDWNGAGVGPIRAGTRW
jgi:putative NADPH-quinone reductase